MKPKTIKTDPYKILLGDFDGKPGYKAAVTNYNANFSRDALISGILSSSTEILLSQLKLSASLQGKQFNKLTGEMPGRIHHEYPAVEISKGTSTLYNACDTTSLFLIGFEALMNIDPDMASALIQSLMPNIKEAIDNILAMVNGNDLFTEMPPPGSHHFALKVTYWKDSILPHANGKEEPKYPVVYTLAHFMAARALISAARIVNEKIYAQKATKIYIEGINNFIRPDKFVIYRDSIEELAQISSDELHSLAYIPIEFMSLLPLESIRKRSNEIKTIFGYLSTPMSISEHLKDKYHANKIWIFEQALIHYGATKFGLIDQAETAKMVAGYVNDGQEILDITDAMGHIEAMPAGNDQQLWSIAAAQYFAADSTLISDMWL